jgi:hypothetical protein
MSFLYRGASFAAIETTPARFDGAPLPRNLMNSARFISLATNAVLVSRCCQRFANEMRKPNENKRDQSSSDSSGFTGFFRFRGSLITVGVEVRVHLPAFRNCRQPRKHVPIFSIDYHVDPVRQSIADTWPHSLDASVARQDRNFSPWYDLAAMMADIARAAGRKDQCAKDRRIK